MNKEILVNKLYKKAYTTHVDDLKDRFANEDATAASQNDSLNTRTLMGAGAGALGGLLLTKLLDSGDNAGIGRYLLAAALGAAVGGGGSYYFNKPAVTSTKTRDDMLEDAEKKDKAEDAAGKREGVKAINHWVGQGGMGLLTYRDIRRRLRSHNKSLDEALKVDGRLKRHEFGKIMPMEKAIASYAEPTAMDYATADAVRIFNQEHQQWAAGANPDPKMEPKLEGRLTKDQRAALEDARKAWKANEENIGINDYRTRSNARLKKLHKKQRKLRRAGYVVDSDGVSRAVGARQLKGLGKTVGMGLARHGLTAIAMNLLNKAL